MGSLKDVFKNFSDFTGRMTPSQVMMLFGVVAGTIVGVVLLVGWVNNVTYSRLYSNLEESEAGEVISYLNDNKIPYKLGDGGRSIEVPSDDVYKTRISLAAEGLPRAGSIGYSLFDKNNLGMTDFLQNLNFRRALEGELTRTIMQLSEVQAARVHIVIPKDRLFREDKKEATASVLLKLKGHAQLARAQIAGISHLVASSVEGLSPENITIVDYEGNLLSGGRKTDRLAGLSSSQLEVRQSVESYLEEKAQSMLDGVLGVGKAIVRVTADLNFQQVEKTAETYDPNAPVIRSEERTRATNSATDKSEQLSESNKQDNTETIVTNYEINKTVEHIINAVGTVDRLSVAVMVDGTYPVPEGGSGGDAAPVYQPRSAEELDRLAAVVRNAVGFQPQRNDQIEMFNIPFDRQELQIEQQQLDTMYQRDFYWEIGKKVGIVLLVILAFFYLKSKSKKLFKALGGMMPAPRPHHYSPSGPSAIQDEEEPSPIVLEKRKPRLVDHMQQTAKEKPDEVAKVIKTLMIE
ncbi:MAG: flagellar M-ring protein FliF [candidate division Zixibacteria bacterium]|nr:flagellar M-ring protein FliF [candidate division Zixibacteria bacterium]